MATLEMTRPTAELSGSPISAGTPAGTSAHFDLPQLLDRCLGNMRLVDKLISGFRRSLATNVPTLRGLAEAGDMPGVALLAHRLKGEAANVAAPDVRHWAARIEDFATREWSDEVADAIGHLEQISCDLQQGAGA